MKHTIAFLLCLLAGAASAQQDWDYTSAPMTQTTSYGIAPVITEVTGQIDLAQALNPNEANQIVTPTAFSFGGVLTSDELLAEEGTGTTPVFEFSTQNGQITDWSVSIAMGNLPSAEASEIESFVSTPQGDFVGESFNVSCAAPYPTAGCYATSAVSTQAGTFVDPMPAAAPEIDWGHSATGLTLLVGIALVLNRRRECEQNRRHSIGRLEVAHFQKASGCRRVSI